MRKKRANSPLLYCVYFFGHKKNTPEGVLFFEKEKEKVEKRDNSYFRMLP